MEKYDYKQAVLDDIRQYLEERYSKDELRENLSCRHNRDRFEQEVYDDMFVSDSVTGNASGSYTFNSWQAEENLCHNHDLLGEAMEEFGCSPKILDSAEGCDVTIRCYLLSQCLEEVLNDLADELEEDDEEKDDEDE